MQIYSLGCSRAGEIFVALQRTLSVFCCSSDPLGLLIGQLKLATTHSFWLMTPQCRPDSKTLHSQDVNVAQGHGLMSDMWLSVHTARWTLYV